MITTNLLSGERVALRAMEPEDLEILYTLENNTDIWNVSSINAPYSRYTLKQFIAKGTHDVYTDGQLRLMIESIEDGTVIGMVDLVDFNPRHLRAEIGIILAHDYQNKGFGTEVLFLMERYENMPITSNMVTQKQSTVTKPFAPEIFCAASPYTKTFLSASMTFIFFLEMAILVKTFLL